MSLPPFWPANPCIWCVQVEEQFSRWGITSLRTLYEEMVCALPTKYATEIQDLRFHPPEDEPNEKLNQQLIARLANLYCQKLRQLFTAEELGTGSQPGCYTKCNCYRVKRRKWSIVHFCITILTTPSNVLMIEDSANEMTINKLVEMADRIMDVGTPTISSISRPTKGGDIFKIIREKVVVTQWTQEWSSPHFSAKWNRRGRNRSLRNSSSQGQSPAKQQANQEGICWYHHQFCPNAPKCRLPCTAEKAGASL